MRLLLALILACASCVTPITPDEDAWSDAAHERAYLIECIDAAWGTCHE